MSLSGSNTDGYVDESVTGFGSQSSLKHVAIIMDGNRRWARSHGLPAAAGHRRGLERAVDLLPAFSDSGIEALTLFAFSAANWQRQEKEVNHLLRLADQALRRFTPACQRESVRIEVIGRKDRLPDTLLRGIDQAMESTARGTRCLRIAFDYSSRAAIVEAAREIAATADCESFAETLGCRQHGDVDLLIRTGKEQRLSDFLLWECAFAELYFPDLYWPEFDVAALRDAINWYEHRERRFGA